MNQTFHNLDYDKQQRIINAALKEFAENGYEKASTNQIVKNAGIGKGMLFYYFQNKKELHNYLVEYCLNITVNEYIENIDTNETDFIERCKQAAKVKTEYHLKNPNVLHFLGNFFLSEDDVPEKYKIRYEEILKLAYSKLYDNIDESMFRDDVDREKAFKLIQWSIEGYQNDLMKKFKNQNLTMIDFDPYWDEFYEYLEVLKTLFYMK